MTKWTTMTDNNANKNGDGPPQPPSLPWRKVSSDVIGHIVWGLDGLYGV